MSEDDNNYSLTAVGKLLQRRAKKTKLFWLSCVPPKKRLKKASASTSTVCDGQTQTSPTVDKVFSLDVAASGDMAVESCVVESSRHSLDSDSDVYMGSFDSYDHADASEEAQDTHVRSKRGNCLCSERVSHHDLCQWRLHGNEVLEKLTDLQQEVNFLRDTLGSLKTGERMGSASVDNSTPPPPPASLPPPPPPPFPPSPLFQHSDSQFLIQKRSVSKLHLDEACPSQDRGKPIITLEDLQKVKLRQVSYTYTTNAKC